MNLELAFHADEPDFERSFAELEELLDAEFLREVDEIFERAARGEVLLDLDLTPPSLAV